ncbi:MAG: radical SAM protein [Anaeroplasmataceae bacterium]
MKKIICNAKYNSLSYCYVNDEINEDICCKFPNLFLKNANGHTNNKSFSVCEKCNLREYYNEFDVNNGIQNIVIRMGNRCNLKCLMCNETYSSKFGKLYESNEYTEFYIDKIRENMSTLKVISLIGGEPFLYADIINRIVEIVKDTDIMITMNTNCTIYEYDFIENLFLKIKNIDIMLSIDGYDSNSEIRVGSPDISKIIDNCKKIYSHKKYITQKITVNTVVSTLNIATLSNEIDSLLAEIKNEISYIRYSVLISPSIYSIITNADFVDELIKLIELMNDKYKNIEFNKSDLISRISLMFNGDE